MTKIGGVKPHINMERSTVPSCGSVYSQLEVVNVGPGGLVAQHGSAPGSEVSPSASLKELFVAVVAE